MKTVKIYRLTMEFDQLVLESKPALEWVWPICQHMALWRGRCRGTGGSCPLRLSVPRVLLASQEPFLWFGPQPFVFLPFPQQTFQSMRTYSQHAINKPLLEYRALITSPQLISPTGRNRPGAIYRGESKARQGKESEYHTLHPPSLSLFPPCVSPLQDKARVSKITRYSSCLVSNPSLMNADC
jgi:hypothetical protein